MRLLICHTTIFEKIILKTLLPDPVVLSKHILVATVVHLRGHHAEVREGEVHDKHVGGSSQSFNLGNK